MADDTNQSMQPTQPQPRKPEALKASAEKIVDSLAGLADDVRQFPQNMNEARLQLALQGLDAALASPTPGSTLTRDEAAAALLIGRGMTFEEAARALGVTEGQLYYWDRSNPSFRNEIRVWREIQEVDIEARLYSTLRSMAANMDDMGASDQIKFMGLMEKVAAKTENRQFRMAELSLKKLALDIQRESVEAQKKAAGVVEQGKHDARVDQIIDDAGAAVYEVVDGEVDEDELPELDEL